jgi:CRP/FNR family transcriptional regulator, cyclic AMP receptor protein
VNVSAEVWARLIATGAPRFFDPGAVLLRQGDAATHVLILVSGRVKALRTAPDGSVLVLAVRGPGEIIGDITVLGGGTRSATVIAVDRCETRIVPADRFILLVRSLRLEVQIFGRAMARILEGDAWRAELASLPAAPRLARTLLRLAVPSPGGPPDVNLDQAELGQAAGLARSTVAAELARLRAQRIVKTSRRRVVIIDATRLQAIAQSDASNV